MTATSSTNARSLQEEEDGRQRRRLSSSSSSSKQQQKINRNIMKDETGHVNRQLAENLWQWEQNSRQEKQLPKVEYSVRSGLRLVDKQVKESLLRRGVQSKNSMYADLVQEGLTALLDAMSHYREEKDLEGDFEVYAGRQIHKHLEQILYQDRRPIRLPRSVQNVLRKAKRVSQQMAAARAGQRPSVAAVAMEMDIPVQQLQDYLHLTRRRSMLSMESTVEVVENDAAHFVDQEDWEISQNMVLDDGHMVHKDELIDEFLDEMVELEGDDQAWIHQEQIAGPLQDLIPDDSEPSPDDSVLMEVIRQDMTEFLDATLDPVEIKVVRMIFGLDSGRQVTIKRTAEALDMDPGKVSVLLAGSLEKLRASIQSRYVEPYLDDENMVDSV